MATIKPKDMPIFTVLSWFGQSYKNYQYSERLARLFTEIEFKFSAVSTAFDLILKQEEVIQKEQSKLKKTGVKSYKSEIKQMAYLGFFLDAVYALLEKVSQVTRVFHNNSLPNGFSKQRKRLLNEPDINRSLSKLVSMQNWFDLFIELREQHVHFGTSVLAFEYDKDPEKGSSQLIMETYGGRRKKVLTNPRYTFALSKTAKIKNGVKKYIQNWSMLLLDKLDKNITITGRPKRKGELTLQDFLKDRKNPV